MKGILSFLCWLSIVESTSQNSNVIDRLTTDTDVVNFWEKVVVGHKRKINFLPYFNETIRVADSLGAKNWIKTDFDQNGETDLLIFRKDGLTDMSFILAKAGKYDLAKPEYYIFSNKYQFIYPIIKHVNGKNLILLYNQEQLNYDSENSHYLYSKLLCDTLAFEDGRVLNYSSHPQKHYIQKVIIENDGNCEGDCPKTTVTIDSKSFSSTALKQGDDGKRYRGSLSKQDIQTINDLLNYANFPKLKSAYRVREFDQTTTTLTVVYDGGKKKVITDYGSTGNFTLAEIYKLTYGIHWVATR